MKTTHWKTHSFRRGLSSMGWFFVEIWKTEIQFENWITQSNQTQTKNYTSKFKFSNWLFTLCLIENFNSDPLITLIHRFSISFSLVKSVRSVWYSKNPHKRTKILRTSSLKLHNPFWVKMVLWSKYDPYQIVLLPEVISDHNLITYRIKQDKTLELSKHWSPDSTPARSEVIMKMTYPVNQ